MPLTIRTRMLLATNLLVAGIGLVVGWLAIGVAGREIEHKLIDESVVQAAGIIQQMNLPRTSDALLKKVGQILGAEAASGPADGCGIVAASLSETAQRSLAAQLAAGRPAHPRVTSRHLADTLERRERRRDERVGEVEVERRPVDATRY